jgi:hypothetical protein
MASTMPGTASDAVAIQSSHCRAGSVRAQDQVGDGHAQQHVQPAARPQYSSVLRIMPLESWNTVA